MNKSAKLADFLRVNSMKRALFLAALCTTFAVLAAISLEAGVILASPQVFGDASVAVLVATIPTSLIISAPLSFCLFHTLRLLNDASGHGEVANRFDLLTGVYQRALFIEKTNAMLEDGGALLLVDADHLSRIRSRHGNDVADETLRKFALALRAASKPTTLIGRLSSEEFGVFIPRGKSADANAAALRMNAAVCALCHTIMGREIHVTASIGGALHQQNLSLPELIRMADKRLLAAKSSGRDRAILCDVPSLAPDFSNLELWNVVPSQHPTSATA